ncbi:hypothetical protein [Pedobacter frigidisoli]|uniref:hypothetical protein n=1 Tax=Pedobacter frigidisoli TaxID=2530455 RepID=UPI0029302A5A|nr:hypothetical protein [Pedobacter frigidisoli]
MDNGIILPADCLGFYSIPLDDGCILTEAWLNEHSDFRRPVRPYLYVTIFKTGFDHGILVYKVIVERDTPAQLVYMIVKDEKLLVTCNAGTNESFLSRHAYFALHRGMNYHHQNDFSRYNWFDFFEKGKKKSKYLDVICDRQGLDINLKKKYHNFWRRGNKLFCFKEGEELSERQLPVEPYPNKPDPVDNEVLGYFITAPIWGNYCEHIPILVPYIGQLNKGGKDIRTYTRMLGPDDVDGPLWTERQWVLNIICFHMADIAWLAEQKVWCNKISSEAEEIASRRAQIFTLWHEVWPYLATMLFIKFYGSTDRGLLRGKPNKRNVDRAVLSDQSPKICFKLRDCKQYYELLMFVKVGKRVFTPSKFSGIFFVRSDNEPDKYYLWDSIQDVRLAAFFGIYNYGFLVLRCHFNGVFASFIERLSVQYEFL